MDRELIDLYSDYLISAFGPTTATTLSRALDGALSHDTITRFLSEQHLTSRDYWKLIKPVIRKVQTYDAAIAIDDFLLTRQHLTGCSRFIVEKPHSDENAIIAYHYDHTQGRSVKGMNIVDAVYITPDVRLPLDFAVVSKGEPEFDFEHNCWRRSNSRTKFDLYQQMLRQAKENGVPFSLVLNDVWYSSSGTMTFVKKELGKDFVMPIKANRRVKLVGEKAGPFQQVSSLSLDEGKVYAVVLDGVPFEVYLSRVVFRNEDGSEGVLYLVTSLAGLSGEEMVAAYQKRWRIEEVHKSLQQNASIASSPAWVVPARLNHVFCAFVGVVKLEVMRVETRLSHFALRGKLYLSAVKAAMGELERVRGANAFRCNTSA